jgi:hypothetical protein
MSRLRRESRNARKNRYSASHTALSTKSVRNGVKMMIFFVICKKITIESMTEWISHPLWQWNLQSRKRFRTAQIDFNACEIHAAIAAQSELLLNICSENAFAAKSADAISKYISGFVEAGSCAKHA